MREYGLQQLSAALLDVAKLEDEGEGVRSAATVSSLAGCS